MDKNNKKNYEFKSLGIRSRIPGEYAESTLFPKGTEVTLSSGKFPLTDLTDTNKRYIIGNKDVILDGFTHGCTGSPVVNECTITVVKDTPTAGGRRRRKTKKAHRRRRSSRKRTSK